MRALSIKRFVSWLIRTPHFATTAIGRTNSAATVLEFDPFWHGDHWQNLLASPMDARHYVMEDWAQPVEDDEVDDQRADGTPSATRRRLRG